MVMNPWSWLAFPVSVVAILLLRPLAGSMGLLDQPGGRKTHHGVIPTVGGLGMFCGLLTALLSDPALDPHGYIILGLAGGMLLMGAVDDRVDLQPRTRLIGQVGAAVLLVWSTGYVVPGLGDLLGIGGIGLGPLAAPFTVVAAVAMINAFNMLDGLDGLAGGCALVCFAGLTLLAGSTGEATLICLGIAIIASTLGFLLFNLPLLPTRRWRVFMGDAGSTMLGFLISAFGLVLLQNPGPAVPAALILWLVPIPIFELFWSVWRRVKNGLHPAEADNGHFHHLLVRAGLSVRMIFLVYLLFSAVSTWTGLALHARGSSDATLFLGFILLAAAWAFLMFALPKLRLDSVRRLESLREGSEPPGPI